MREFPLATGTCMCTYNFCVQHSLLLCRVECNLKISEMSYLDNRFSHFFSHKHHAMYVVGARMENYKEE